MAMVRPGLSLQQEGFTLAITRRCRAADVPRTAEQRTPDRCVRH
jgi:hypothetical protein